MSTRCPAQVKRTTGTGRKATRGRLDSARCARPVEPSTAIVTGATGQDGYYLVRRLLADGWTVHAAVRDLDAAEAVFGARRAAAPACAATSAIPGPLRALVGDVRPEEVYNLAGESSVSASFDDPQATWESNAHVVVHLLDAIRLDSPATRFYQASSGEMFGSVPGESVVHDESAALNPQSPYAAAKAAAHMLCRSYRESYGIRIACGILFNHESRRRGASSSRARSSTTCASSRAGIADGPARARKPEGAARLGLRARLRRGDGLDPPPGRELRGVADEAASYRDYVLGTGRAPSVWELADRAFALAGFELDWELDGRRPARLVGALRRLRRAGRRRRPGVHPALRPEGDRRRPDPDRSRARLEAAAGPRPLPRRHARRAGLVDDEGQLDERAEGEQDECHVPEPARAAGRARSRSRAPTPRPRSACRSPSGGRRRASSS